MIDIFDINHQPGLSKAYAASEPLLQSSDVTYLGSFRVPDKGYGYSSGPIAYNPNNNSLFLQGHVNFQKTGEISIPELVQSSKLSDLKTATVLQPMEDLTEGHRGELLAGGASYKDTVHLGGLLVYGNKLIGTAYIYFDANSQARRSHFISGLNFKTQGDFQGMFQVGNGQINSGFYAGYIASIPEEWQSALGGVALTGLCCTPIISRTSWGPAAFVFNPDDLGVKDPVPATPLLYYNSLHPTLGTWGNESVVNPYFNMGSGANRVVFPNGSKSVLFFGAAGLGIPCYGEGTKDISLDRKLVPGNSVDKYCYDPAISSKGNHAYPYKPQVWAYNVDDFIAVKNGEKNPWDIRPYALWNFDYPLPGFSSGGVAYDPATQRIFIAQTKIDPGSGNFYGPVIHVYQINLLSVVSPKPLPQPLPLPLLRPTPSLPTSSSTPIATPTPIATITPTPIATPTPKILPIPTPSVDNYAICNNENATCNFSGTKRIKYGTKDRFVILIFSNSVDCNNKVFGDPAPGIVKSCYVGDNVSTPILTPTPTPAETHQVSITPALRRIFLMRSEGSPKVYYITEKGFKRWIPNEKIFLSYGNKWTDVVVVPQAQIDEIGNVALVRVLSNPRVYMIESGVKHWVTSPEAFNRNGFKWEQIAPINSTELDYYAAGATIK